METMGFVRTGKNGNSHNTKNELDLHIAKIGEFGLTVDLSDIRRWAFNMMMDDLTDFGPTEKERDEIRDLLSKIFHSAQNAHNAKTAS